MNNELHSSIRVRIVPFMTIASRLDEAMRAAGFRTQSALAQASGIPQPTINRILKGTGKRGPESGTLAALAQTCNVTFEWLHEGIGPMERPANVTSASLSAAQPVIAVDDLASDFVQIPLVELKLQAGVPGFLPDPEFSDSSTMSLPKSWIDLHNFDPRYLVASRVRGKSMYPTLDEDDIVVTNLLDRGMVDGKIYSVNYDGMAMIKRLEKDGGLWYIASDNPQPEFKRRLIANGNTEIVGRIVQRLTDWA